MVAPLGSAAWSAAWVQGGAAVPAAVVVVVGVVTTHTLVPLAALDVSLAAETLP